MTFKNFLNSLIKILCYNYDSFFLLDIELSVPVVSAYRHLVSCLSVKDINEYLMSAADTVMKNVNNTQLME